MLNPQSKRQTHIGDLCASLANRTSTAGILNIIINTTQDGIIEARHKLDNSSFEQSSSANSELEMQNESFDFLIQVCETYFYNAKSINKPETSSSTSSLTLALIKYFYPVLLIFGLVGKLHFSFS